MSKLERDLSKGSVPKQLITFAVPFIISNLIQSLYSMVDMIIVGQFAGTIAMSGVNIGGQVQFIITNLVFGITAGATVMIGQYKGADDRKGLRETIATLFSVLGISAVVLTAVMLFARRPILNLIQTPAPSYEDALSYLLVSACGTIFIFGYNALSAVMRGMGDSRRPLYFVAIACVTNVVLDLVFVGSLKWGAFGAALATVIAQALSMLLCIIYLKRNDFIFDFNRESFRIHKDRLRLILKIGLPMSIQNFCTSLSFTFLTTMVNVLDPTAIYSAAVGAVGKINGFGVMPAFAMSNAISAMSAQNLGAGEEKRAVKTMKIGMAFALGMGLFVFIITRIWPEQLIRIFDNDPGLLAAGKEYIHIMGYDFILVALWASLNGLFIGSGHSTASLAIGTLSSLLIRIPVCYIFGIVLDMGLFGVGLGAPVASGVAFLIGLGYYASGRWKVQKIVQRGGDAPSEPAQA